MFSIICLVLSLVVVNGQLQDCELQGQTYKNGESFTAPDGCNTCFCTNGAAACTLKFCLPSVSRATCQYGTATYHNGDSFKSLDGCNTCSCFDGGVVCTEMFCMQSTETP
ncbi:hypothetical protein ACF0H5_018039 [Mactra antiquata]